VAIKVVDFDEFDVELQSEVMSYIEEETKTLKYLKDKCTFKFTCELYGFFR
jgi:hypothetical protein